MGIFRRMFLFVLGLLLLVLIPLSVFGFWSRETLLDTDHYVEAVGPLASDGSIQAQVTLTLMSFLDDLASGAGGSSTMRQQLIDNQYSNLRPTIESTVTQLLDTESFRLVWEGVNREAHQSLVLLLKGKAPTDEQGRVTLNLNPVYEDLQTALLANGITVLEGIEPSENSLIMPLFQASELTEVESYVKLFDRVAGILPIITIVLALLFVLLFPRKFRGLFWLGLLTAIGMVVLIVGRSIGRDATIGSVSEQTTRDALGAIYDETTKSLNEQVLLIAIISVVVLVVAFIGGRMTRQRRY